MDNWDRIKTAYQVARMGTVSGRGPRCGRASRHRIRHVDALERRLASTFQRHARGYQDDRGGRRTARGGRGTDDQLAVWRAGSRGAGEGGVPRASWCQRRLNGTVELDDAAVGPRSRREPGC